MTVSDGGRAQGKRPAVGLGMVAAICGFLILPFGDAIGKILVLQDIAVVQVTWGRWFFHALLLTPFVLIGHGRVAFKIPNPLLQFCRAAALAIATVFFFAALKIIPLANATAVLFVAPLIVVALSAVFLKEQVGMRRWGAVIVGLGGVLLIIRPTAGTGGDGVDVVGALLAFGAALGFALYIVLTRRAAGKASPVVALWWMGLVGMLLTSFFAFPNWQPLSLEQWGMLGGLGLAMVTGHLLVFWAADRIEASALAVTPYLEMVTSTMLGFFVFGDFPALFTWVGCGIVIAAGLFVAWREHVATAKSRATGTLH